MCTTCGCGGTDRASDDSGVRIDGVELHSHGASHGHPHAHGSGRAHGPDHAHRHHASADSRGPANSLGGPHGLVSSRHRIIPIERDILEKNAEFAVANRERLITGGVAAFNIMSSPGSGKTSLLVRAIADLCDRYAIAVIEGDQQTSNDAERIRATGAPAIQVNTGKSCHLDAHMIAHALDGLPLPAGALLFIENVGNLVCPAAFDLGEARKIVVFSVTEGEDKPIKYPDMFAAADLLLINKADLIPYVDFDLARAIGYARQVKSDVTILVVSTRTGEGMSNFYNWIASQAETCVSRKAAE